LDRKFDDCQTRVEAAEGALREIHAAVAYWILPNNGIEDQDLIAVITEILEAYGLPLVADDAFELEPAPNCRSRRNDRH
jgi:hypothetical protein